MTLVMIHSPRPAEQRRKVGRQRGALLRQRCAALMGALARVAPRRWSSVEPWACIGLDRSTGETGIPRQMFRTNGSNLAQSFDARTVEGCYAGLRELAWSACATWPDWSCRRGEAGLEFFDPAGRARCRPRQWQRLSPLTSKCHSYFGGDHLEVIILWRPRNLGSTVKTKPRR